MLDEVLYLPDQMYVHARFWTIEQPAFSVCLQQVVSAYRSLSTIEAARRGRPRHHHTIDLTDFGNRSLRVVHQNRASS
jgi:hypothetical protein